MPRAFRAVAFALAIAVLGPGARADEGMWTFDNFPAAKVAAAYGVTIDQAWLDHVRASTLRLTSGCSASIVSGEIPRPCRVRPSAMAASLTTLSDFSSVTGSRVVSSIFG